MSKPKKRKKGGQPGNTNALRHGFYSRKFQELEAADLDKIRAGLVDEIAMLRVSIRRVFDHSTDLAEAIEEIKRDLIEKSATDGDNSQAFSKLNVLSSALSTLGIATTRLAHMLRTQKFLDGGSDDPLEELILEALETME